MTGAGADADPDDWPGRRWDVALSFAGAQREYVGQVAAALKAQGVVCFYDADRQVRLWGTNLAEELPRIYERESAVVVVFVSADYAKGDWARLERRAAFSRAVHEAGVYLLPARFDDTELPGLIGDVVAINLRDYTPGQFADLVVAKLGDLGISPTSSLAEAGRRPPGAVRVSEANPRRLGVHAAISVPGVPDETLPEYVPRDADVGVRAKVEAAARRGGFVLLIGGSSVGKTRCAVQVVRTLLPDWWLVHPAGSDQVAALAAAPTPRTVVWLDELQRYFDGEHGLVGAVRTLLNAPAVIIGTLWPDRYAAYTSLPAPGGADPHMREREVLDLASVIRIAPAFSPAEQNRARAAAARDPQLQVALEAAGYGLTQTLAAAPQLVARWQDAQTASPYGWAVLTAALDTARLGVRAPLSADFLRAAAPGYCTSQQLAEAPGDWFERALAYVIEKLHGAVAALSPAGSRIGHVDGYTAADYLIQHASQERRSDRVPASTWDALLGHIRDPADAARLAESARNRLLYHYAIPLYRDAADADDRDAARELAGLLARRGDLEGLRARAADGDEMAAGRLVELLAERGDLEGLRARAADDRRAAWRLADLLAEHGDLDGAVQILRPRADAGDWTAAERLVGLLAEHGDLDGLRARADAGDKMAVWPLADLLAERGDLEGLRARVDAGDEAAAERLAGLLAAGGDLDGLRARADAGDEAAAFTLAGPVDVRDLDELRARAEAGDQYAAFRLASSPLIKHNPFWGGAQMFPPGADVGDWAATRQLAERGDLGRLRTWADEGDEDAARKLAGLLAERGDLDGAVQILRPQADVGDRDAAFHLGRLLAECGDMDGLYARADAGDRHTAGWLAEALIKQGRSEEAERLRRFGLNPDGSIACA